MNSEPSATETSAIVVSSVSPDRWLTTTAYPFRKASVAASKASDIVPIWFSFKSKAFAAPRHIPLERRRTPLYRYMSWSSKCFALKAKPNWNDVRSFRCRYARLSEWVHGSGKSPIRRDRRYDDCRRFSRAGLRVHKNWGASPE